MKSKPSPVTLTGAIQKSYHNNGFLPEDGLSPAKNGNFGIHRNGAISIISGPSPADNSSIVQINTIQSAAAANQNGGIHHHPVTALNGKQNQRHRDNNSSNGGINASSTHTPESDDPKASSKVVLKRSLNLWYCCAIMVAVTGHSSIFISPSQIIATSGSLGSALVIWLVGGLINLGTALCFAELGTMNPTAGGPYNQVMKSFGTLIGFLLIWGYAILIAAPFWAFLSYTAALYIIRPVFPDCLPDDIILAIRLLAGWIMVSMVVINCVYMKYVTRFGTLLSSCKIVALLIIIGAGIYNLAQGETENFEDMFADTTHEPGKIALSFFYAVFSYGGWQVMTTMLEEMKDPARDPPRSVIISFIVVISKYILTNVAYATLMSRSDIVSSPAVALDFADQVYRPLVPVISVLVALTSIGALNASIMGHSRLLMGGSRGGILPQVFGMVHTKYVTPWPAIFVFTVMGLVMLFSGELTTMMEYISLFATIMNVLVITTQLYLRVTQPDTPRPYKPWLFVPVLSILLNAAILILGVYQKPQELGVALAILFSGVPVYLFGVLYKVVNGNGISSLDNFTANLQKLLSVTKTKQS